MTIVLIVALSVFMDPTSVKAGVLRAVEGGSVDIVASGYGAPDNIHFSKISGNNAFFDDTTGIVCPEDISTYTDINACNTLISSGLELIDQGNNISSLSWQLEGATEGSSSASGINQLTSYVFNEGTTLVTYRGKDRSNQPVFCSFTVVVADNEIPRLMNPPGNISVEADPGDCHAVVNWQEPIVLDNCASRDQIIVDANYMPGSAFPIGTTEVFFSISDGVEYNRDEYSFTVTVTDNEKPEIYAPHPIHVKCGDPVPEAFTSWRGFTEAGGVAFDNCNINVGSFRFVGQKSNGIRCPYTVTRTYSIADDYGNITEVEHLVYVTGEEEVQEEPQTEPVFGLKSGTAAAESVIFTSNGTFTPPAGVTSIIVEAWGSGGGGAGSNQSKYGGGGGGGGAYTINNSVSVVQGTSYNIVIGVGGNGAVGNYPGQNGTASIGYFGATTVSANGGKGGAQPQVTTGGAGGTAGTYAGGAGGAGGNNASNAKGGGGGSSAGISAVGVTGGTPAGATAPIGGGNGGNGGAAGGSGLPGAGPGGGGGGGGDGKDVVTNGGKGADGQMIISWNCPTYSISAVSVPSPFCQGTSKTITLTGSGLPVGTYTVTYNLSGANTLTNQTATMTVSSSGTGTFTTPVFSNSGSTTIVITNLASGSGAQMCNTPIFSGNSNTFDVIQNPLSSPISISGNTTVCAGETNVSYSISGVSGATTYTWTVPSGWSITSGQGTTNIQVTTGSGGTNGNISVVAKNDCSTSSPKTLAVTVLQNAAVGAVSGTSPLCIGATATYSASGVVLGGGTGSWSSDNTSVATVDPTSGLVTAIGAGSAQIIYTITGGCGGTVAAQKTLNVNPDAAISSVSGTTPLCIGSADTYSASGVVLGGGTGAWSSSNTSVATVNSSGVVTAVGVGTTTIKYTISGGCNGTPFAEQLLTVNPNASVGSVSGTTPLCIGSVVTFSASGVVLGGGTGGWSSSNTAVASVDPVSGVVTANAAGTATITFSISGGCNGTPSKSTSVTVHPDASVGSVSGTTPLCIGSVVTFSASGVVLGGGAGTWSSSNPAVATVNSTTGVVTTLAAGSTDIIYTINGGCNGTPTAQQTLVVDDYSIVDAGPATPAICQGGTTDPLGGSYDGSATGVTWTSSVGGSFIPNANDPNAQWTPPSNYKGLATLTITSTGPCATVNDSKQVQVYEQPAIVVQPVDMTDCYYRIVEFNVTATGAGLMYTWMRKRPSDATFLTIPVSDPKVSYLNSGATIHLVDIGEGTYNPDGTQYKVLVTNGNCSVESNVVTLTVNKISEVNGSEGSASATNVTLCYGTSFSYTVVTNHPENIVSYQWKKWVTPGEWQAVSNSSVISGAQTATLSFSNATENESGEYQVKVEFSATSSTDCSAASDNFDRTITFLPAVEPVINTADQTICSGTASSLLDASVSGGSGTSYTYQWQSSPDNSTWTNVAGANSEDYQPPVLISTTYYRLVVTDSGTNTCGSGTSTSVSVTVDAAPTATAGGSQTICPNSTAKVSGATATNYTSIVWSHNGAGSLSDETTLAPTYTPDLSDVGSTVALTMTVTGVGACGTTTATATYSVTVEDLPSATISYPNVEECADAGNISVSISGTSGGTFSASPAGLSIDTSTGEINTATSTPGVYTVTYNMAATGTCNAETATTTITINALPNATTGSNGNICVGESVELGATAIAGHTYSWTASPADPSLTDPTMANPTVSPSVTTVYTLTETIDATGCTKSNSVTVTSSQPIDIIIDPNGESICSGETTNISVTSNYIGTSFSWTPVLQHGSTTSGFANGSGNLIADLLVNTSTTSIDTVRYNIVATAGTCVNESRYVDVAVYPTVPIPTISATATVLCDGENSTLTSSSSTGNQWYFNGNPTPGATGGSYVANASGAYTVEVSDGNGCKALSAATIIAVNPLPLATVSGTTAVCENASSPYIVFKGSGGTGPYTITYNIDGVVQPTVTTGAGDSVAIAVSTGNTGIFNYNLESVSDNSATACSQTTTGTATITVNPLPTAIVSGDAIVCEGDAVSSVVFTGSNGTEPYTFTYNINGGTSQTITTTSGNSVSVSVPTTSTGTFAYNLLSVKDASSTACSNPVTGTVNVTVNELANASISGDTTICEGDVEPEITFTASGGTPDYTFYYHINSGGSQSVVSSGNSVTITAPTDTPGSFVYTLDSVKDASSTACVNAAVGSITVKVNELPTATISGNDIVCQYESMPVILFSGSGGKLPYKFRYRINGSALQTVSTNGGSSATVFVDTNVPGTYIYTLYDVEDGSSTDCVNSNVADTVIVTVKPESSVSIASSEDEVCLGDGSPVITITGHGGEMPYTFVYRINNGAFQTASTSATDSVVTLPVPTAVADTFVYEVTSVTDGGSSSCIINTNETYQVVISPSLDAVVDLTSDIPCVGGSGQVTITATAGTPPFIYYFNGASSVDGIFNNVAKGTYSWYVTDISRCDSVSGTFTIEDPDSLHFNIPLITDVACPDGNDGSIVISAYGGGGAFSYSISPNEGTQSPVGTFTGLSAQDYTITVTDANNCTWDTIVTVGTVSDTIDPIITGCPADITVYTGAGRTSCDQVATWTAPNATDNCTGVGALTWTLPAATSGSTFPVGDSLITYIVADAAGNTDTCSFLVSVVDNTAPVPPVSLPQLEEQCQFDTIIPPFAIDNCSDTVYGVPNITFPYTVKDFTTVQWTFTDESGNSSTKNQILKIKDNTSPTWTSYPDNFITIDCNGDTAIAVTGMPIATDNCEFDRITYKDSIVGLNNNCQVNYTLYRKFRAYDVAGNYASWTQTIVAQDNTPPDIFCESFYNYDANVVPSSDLHMGVTGSDNCSPESSLYFELVYEHYFGLEGSAGFCPDSLIRQYTVKDMCGNYSDTCTQMYYFAESSDCEACIDDPSTTEDDVPFFPAILDGNPDSLWTSPRVSRNGICCFAEGPPPPRCISFNVYLDEDAVGFIFDFDGAAPSGSEYFHIDCGPPQVVGDTICLAGGRFYTLTFCKPGDNANTYWIQSISGAVVAEDIITRADDNCIKQINVDGLEPGTITWTVSEPAGADSLLKYLSCTDCENPVFTPDSITPPNIVYEVCGQLKGTVICDGVLAYDCDYVHVTTLEPIKINFDVDLTGICENAIPPINAEITPTNLVYSYEWFDGPDGTGTRLSTNPQWQPPGEGTFSLVVTETQSGVDCNSAITNFNITYDTVGPTGLFVPDTLFLDCSDPNYDLSIAQWLDSAYAFDLNMSSIPDSNDYTYFNPTCGGNQTVHFWASDSCNNKVIDSAVIWIVDDIAPIILDAQDSIADCSSMDKNQHEGYLAWLMNHGGASATDDCEHPDSLIWTNNAATQSWVGDGARDSITVTFTVTDDCGNSAQTTATFTIKDDLPPSITCPDPVETIIGQDSCSSENFVIDSVFAYDDCSVPLIEWTMVGATTGNGTGQVIGQSFNIGITTVQYIAIDGAGLTDTCSFTVWVKHLNVPTAHITCPTDSVWAKAGVDCYASVVLETVVWTDPCNELDSIWNNSPYRTSPSDASGSYPIGVTDFTWYISDVSGNIDSCNVTVIVEDETAPYFTSCPVDTLEDIIDAANCDMTNFSLVNPTYEVGCGADLRWTLSGATTASGVGLIDPSVVSFNVGITSITYILEDESGNADTCIYWAWAKHVDFPTANITCPADTVRADADPSLCVAVVALDTVIWTDPCNEIDSIWNNSPFRTSQSDASGSYPIGVTDFTWYISDVSGNTDSCNVVVIVSDVDPPQFTTCPDTIEGLIDPLECEITNFPLQEPTWTEACGAELTWRVTPVTSATVPGTGSGFVPAGYVFSPGQTRITYVLTDSGGNTDTCSFIFWPKHQDFPTSNVTCPADSVWATADADCYADVQLDTVIWTDPCNEIDSIWNNSPYRTSLSDASGTYPIGATDFAWYILDVSGNMDSCNVTVIVEDDTAPYFTSCPTDTLEDIINDADCDMTNFTLVNPTYEVGCGADLRWTLSGATNNSGTGLIDPSVVAFNAGITTITYILEDESGNADTCIYWAWAKRANFPSTSITCPPASISVPADPSTCDAFVALDTVVWTDPCNEIDSIWNNSPYRTSYADASGRYPIGTTNFSWFITDVSGNVYNCDVAVTVTDTTSPNITGVTDLTECPEYVFAAGDTQLDLDTLLITDDCADDCTPGEYTIRWRIDFADGSSIPAGSGTYNTGLLSDYGNDILFPADSLTYTTLNHTVTYWVVDCSGNVSAPEIRTVSVYPPPTAIAPADTLSYCYGDTVPAITLNGYPAGDVVFDVSGGNSLGISDMTGVTEIPSFWATTTGTATISITPRANDCVGSPVTFVLIITEPVTVAVSPVFQTICSGETTNIHLMSSNPGAIFSYEVTSISPAGSVTGAIDSTGEYIRHTLINTTQAQATLTYTITATANGCTSPGTATATVTINPTPELIITDPDTVCEPETVDLTAAEITSGSASGLTFTYWVDAEATVSLSNPSAVNQSGTYYIRGSSGAGCVASDSVNVVINPLPELTSPLNPDGICSNTAFDYTPTGNLDSILFTWTRATVSGISNPAESGAGAIDEILVNETNNSIEVTYVYTMITPEGCSDSAEVKVVVTQSPVLTSAPPADICSGQTFSYTPESNISGTTFSWYRNADSFGNAAASGTGNPNEVLVNNSSSIVTVVYHYSLSSNNCTNPTDFLVYVNVVPSPNVTAGADRVEICPGESVNLTSSSDVPTSSLPGTLLTDDFNSSAGNWTASGNSTWQLRDDGYSITVGSLWWTETTTFHSVDNSRFFLSNHYDTDATSYLTSNAFSTVGYTSVSLSFWHYYRRGSNEEAVVEYSTDGATWTALETYTFSRGGASNFENITVSLPVGIPGLSVRFRYRTYSSGWWQSSHYWWAIDNVEITGEGQSEQNVTWTSVPAGFTSTEANPTNIYPTETTTYIVEYTDPDTNCPGYDSVTVVVRDLPDAKIEADYCIIPDKIVLTASGGVSYLWSTGATTQSITIDEVDIYSVLVTDAFGCQNTVYTSVSNELVVNGDFTAGNLGFSSDYNYKPDQPGLVPAGQGELYDDSGNNGYSISTNGQNVHVNFWGYDHTHNTSGGRNMMIVNGHGTSLTIWEQTVHVFPNTDYYFSAWAMSMNDEGNYAQLRFEVNGVQVGTTANLGPGPGDAGEAANSDNYWVRFYSNPLWNSGSVSGPITIRIVNLVGYLAGNDFALDDISFGTLDPLPPVVEAFSNSPVCEGDSIHLSMTVTNGKEPFTYNWTGPNGFAESGQNVSIPNASPSQSGDYIAVVTDGYGCGPVSDTITIVVDPIAIVDAGPDQEVCASEPNVQLAGSIGGSATSATWSGGTGTFSDSTALNAVYILSVADTAAGLVELVLTTNDPVGTCGQATDTMLIIVNPEINIVLDTAINPLCPGSSDGAITVHGINGTEPYSYSWNTVPEQTTQTASNLPQGTYTVTVTDAKGCWDTLSVTIVDPDPLVVDSVSFTEPLCYNGADGTATVVLVSGDNVTYLWSNGDTTATADSLSAGLYTVTVYAENWCMAVTLSIAITQPDPPTVECPEDITVFADYGADSASNVGLEAPVYTNECPLETQTWVLSGVTIDSSAQNVIDTLWVHDFNLGITTVTYTFTDIVGNVSICDFTVTVLAKPNIECPPDTILYLDGAEAACEATYDPGVPDLIEGVPPIEWTYTIEFADGTTVGPVSYTKDASDPYPNPLGELDFPLGLTTIYWRAENQAGFDTCSHWIEVIDTIPPTLDANPYENCVDPLHWAIYNPSNPNPVFNHNDPLLEKFPVDYRTMLAGDTFLDLTSLEDNCCDSITMADSIYWRIEFSDTPDPLTGVAVSHPDITGTGQPSEYVDPVTLIPTDIYLWGDGVTFSPVTHRIFYWVVDCNGIKSEEIMREITITPRPKIEKQ